MFRHQKMMAAFQSCLLTGALFVLVSGRAQSEDPPPKLVFSDLDSDSSGKVSLSEFLKNVPDDQRQRQRVQFFQLDVDENELLSPEEFKNRDPNRKLTVRNEFRSRDQSGNGKLSLKEYLAPLGSADPKVAQRNFSVVDFDRDGELTFEEFKALPGLLPVALRGTVPDPLADLAASALKTWSELLKKADGNQDGNLSAAEWPQAALQAQLSPYGELKFPVWDADGNGLVDETEAERLIAAGCGLRHPDGVVVRKPNGLVLFWSWVRRADRNGDQVVSRAEFIAGYWRSPMERAELFTQLDKDSDGKLTYAEMVQASALNVDELSQFLSLDVDLDGLLTLVELLANASTGATKLQMAQSMAACDDDHDGKLSLREYRLAPAGIGYVTLGVFDRKDADNDGFLGWNEFYTEKSPVLIGLAWELFRRFDLNNDGRLGLDEFQFTVDSTKVPLEVVFRIKDSDRDGRLSFGEVFTQLKPATSNPPDLERYQLRMARAKDKFVLDDVDGNGSLDLEEFTRARQVDAAAPDQKEEYSTRLFIADSDGSNLKQLTDLPEFQKQGSPAWSLDGKFIAFDGWRPQRGETFSASQVIVVQADGGNPRVLCDGAMPSFSPGGHRIVFSNGKARGVWIVSSEGPDKELVQIDEDGWGADWSSDGKIVYATTVGGRANLAVFNLVEGRRDYVFAEQQSPYRQIFWNMAWSPDGKRIVFKGLSAEGKQEVGIVDARGEAFGFARRFTGNVLASFAWSPDQSQILFVKQDPETQRYQIFSIEPDTQNPPQLLPAQDDLRDYSDIAYSPDGKKIVFSCHKRVAPE